jgi:hypothetical protein
MTLHRLLSTIFGPSSHELRKDAGREFKRHLAQEFNADFMIAAPDHPALPARCRPSCQMEREALRKIINVTDRQMRMRRR